MKSLLARPGANLRPLLWNTHHDQPETRRVAVVALLNAALADLLDLRLQAKQAHWNVKGPQFAALHALFDEAAGELDELADVVAERAVVLGGTARGTLQSLSAESRLAAYPLDALGGNDHLWALASTLAHAAATARQAVRTAQETGDDGSTDVFTQVSRALDILLWKVEAHVALEPGGNPAAGRA